MKYRLDVEPEDFKYPESEYINAYTQHEFDMELELLDNEFDTLKFENEISRSSPDYIRWVQNSLNRIIGLRLIVDGVAGPQTRSAIRSFQQRYGLSTDGIVGPQTERAMLGTGAEPPPGVGAAGHIITLPPVVIEGPGFVLDRFAFDRVGLQPFHEPILKLIVERVYQSRRSGQPIRTIRLVGHTDPAGSESYNLSLGKRRGLTVQQQLVRVLEQKERGLSNKVLILVSSRGEKEPVDSNNTEEGRAFNRRVNVFLSTRALQPRPRPQPQPLPVMPPAPPVVEPPPPPSPTRPTCDRAGLERGVNACIGDARKCLIDAHKKLGMALIRCRMNPWCNAREIGVYYLALRRCREALLACDQRVKRETRCT